MADMTFEITNKNFVEWFCSNGGIISSKITFKDYSFENAGRGIVALEDIESNEMLFEIPHSIFFSLKTSSLTSQISSKEFNNLYKINQWFPLIICLMYESQNKDSLWKPYFDILPTEFNTPMFWNEDELEELVGTGLIEKIGRDDVENSFNEYLLSFIQSKSLLFDPNVHNLKLFHQMGSLIMSYAFFDDDEKENDKDDDDDDDDDDDGDDEGDDEGDEREIETDKEENDIEKMNQIMMIPMADMLNHKTGFNNARLFREKGLSQMIATKKINKGEQIYNTYGDLCSSDLLRKYGFVDENNIHDIVEINGQFVVDNLSVEETNKKEKVELLLEEDILDDVFILDTKNNLPPDLIITVKVMMMNKTQFKILKEMRKFPKPKMIPELRNPLIELLKKRLSEYETSINEDEEILNKNNISKKLKNAITVRLSEKRILQNVIDFLVSWEPENVIDKKRRNKRIKVE
ncbi:hypothetical protein Glove_441g90 [Diversispora epigaea]|uniref:Ribosomal lysine N-methyltransferase 4 n=1 Tax=Diversispora epigaea TaxID=1348612 RepID=A0A397GZI3_9GLOM|nr:hypothetical protein Glove_441g90 [Diversispora epigaea]